MCVGLDILPCVVVYKLFTAALNLLYIFQLYLPMWKGKNICLNKICLWADSSLGAVYLLRQRRRLVGGFQFSDSCRRRLGGGFQFSDAY